MTLPASPNTISFNQVNVELGRSGTTNGSLNESVVRTLAGVSSGAIGFSNLHGKSSFPPTYSPIQGLNAAYFDLGNFEYYSGVALTMKRDGTWTMTSGSNQVVDSGNWAVNPSFNIGDQFKIYISSSGTKNGGGYSSSLGPTRLNSDVSFWIDVGGAFLQYESNSANVTVELSPWPSGANVSTSSFSVDVDSTYQ